MKKQEAKKDKRKRLTVALNLKEERKLLEKIAKMEHRTVTQQIEYFLKKAISSYGT